MLKQGKKEEKKHCNKIPISLGNFCHPTFVSQQVFLLLGGAFRDSQVIMKLLKTDRLENPMLIVLAGEERRGKERNIICQQKKKYKVSVSSISRHPVTHFTFSVLSTRLCLAELKTDQSEQMGEPSGYRTTQWHEKKNPLVPRPPYWSNIAPWFDPTGFSPHNSKTQNAKRLKYTRDQILLHLGCCVQVCAHPRFRFMSDGWRRPSFR